MYCGSSNWGPMKAPISLAFVAFALLGAGCGSTSDPGRSSVPETSTTRAASSDLDAWRQCIIDRIGRINSEVSQEIEEIDARLEELSKNLAGLPEQLRNFDSQRVAIQDIFDSGTEMLNAVGIPGTTEQIREDPEIAAALDALEKAQASGEGLDEAIDQMANLGSGKLQDVTGVMERERSHADAMRVIDNEEHDVLMLQGELRQEWDGLERRRRELVAEREDTMTTLEAALDGQQSGDVDWSLCTGS